MKAAALLPRLVQLEAVLDEALHFYIPNQGALSDALKVAGPKTTRRLWKDTFAAARLAKPKPAEVIQGVTVKASNAKVYTSAQPFHPVAAEELRKERPRDYDWLARVPGRAERSKGFRTNLQPHITRGEATGLARRRGWKAAPTSTGYFATASGNGAEMRRHLGP